MLNIGILGCGRIGVVHAGSIARLEGARVTAVSDAVPAAADALAAKTGAQVLDSADLIASADVDAAVIGTPTDTHYDLIHAAAKAGKAAISKTSPTTIRCHSSISSTVPAAQSHPPSDAAS